MQQLCYGHGSNSTSSSRSGNSSSSMETPAANAAAAAPAQWGARHQHGMQQQLTAALTTAFSCASACSYNMLMPKRLCPSWSHSCFGSGPAVSSPGLQAAVAAAEVVVAAAIWSNQEAHCDSSCIRLQLHEASVFMVLRTLSCCSSSSSRKLLCRRAVERAPSARSRVTQYSAGALDSSCTGN